MCAEGKGFQKNEKPSRINFLHCSGAFRIRTVSYIKPKQTLRQKTHSPERTQRAAERRLFVFLLKCSTWNVLRGAWSLPTSRRRIPFLRCLKYSAAFSLEYFNRGAKPCSLFRPLDALRRLCSTWNKGNGRIISAPTLKNQFNNKKQQFFKTSLKKAPCSIIINR